MHHVEYACIQPRRFAIAKRVIQIEAAFHALEKREPFEVTDRNAILEDHQGKIVAQWQASFWQQTHDEDLNTTTQLCSIDIFRIAMREAVKLAITNRRCIACHVECLLALPRR